MKAVVYDRFGPPEVLRLTDVPEPIPAPGEVKLRVHATSVNPMDVVFRSGELKGRMFSGLLKPRLSVLGSDMAGEVVAVGEGVDDLSVGDRVVGISGMSGGAYAEYMCVDASEVAAIPAEIGYPQAAAFSFAGLSSLRFLRAIGGLEPGCNLLVVGASGGLGTFAVQLAHHHGAEVTGVCSSRNVDLVRSLGADDVIDYTSEDPTSRHEAYNVVFDAVAVGSFSTYKKALRPGGIYSSTVVGPRVLVNMAMNRLRCSGKRAHTAIPKASPPRDDLCTLRDLFRAGSIQSVIERRLPLEEAAAGHRHYETGRTRGKVVLIV